MSTVLQLLLKSVFWTVSKQPIFSAKSAHIWQMHNKCTYTQYCMNTDKARETDCINPFAEITLIITWEEKYCHYSIIGFLPSSDRSHDLLLRLWIRAKQCFFFLLCLHEFVHFTVCAVCFNWRQTATGRYTQYCQCMYWLCVCKVCLHWCDSSDLYRSQN